MDKTNMTKEQIIKDYLSKHIELHKNDADFMPEKYNKVWVEDTTEWALKDESTINTIIEWTEKNNQWDSMRALDMVFWYMELYD